MKFRQHHLKVVFAALMLIPLLAEAAPEDRKPSTFHLNSSPVWITLLFIAVIIMLVATVWLSNKVRAMKEKQNAGIPEPEKLKEYLNGMSGKQINRIIQSRQKKKNGPFTSSKGGLLLAAALFCSGVAHAQVPTKPDGSSLLSEGGVIITIALLLIPIVVAITLLIVKIGGAVDRKRRRLEMREAEQLSEYLQNVPEGEVDSILEERKQALDFSLSHSELSGEAKVEDPKGLLRFNQDPSLPFVAIKKKALPRPAVDVEMAKLMLWYIGMATFWLVFGTTVGEYLGIKFVAPDADQLSWLSFGRLRPVHTNSVFWGWASLGMIGLGNYIIPRVGNTKLASYKMAWAALILINASVVIGTICLMAGINNGGGEYREYVWPVQLMFGIGVALTLINYLNTVARRKTKEIYISNWYIVASAIFAIIISLVAYIPLWHDGLGDSITQGYYMHQGVGMWFMLFTLGIVYYFLPQQLNKPIYSYSLGILAFWTQILFYTLIGTHHFVFSAIPWWLQTVGIVGSMGMVIPVVAGSANFILTFKGAWYKVKDSYTLPFFLVGIVFYFTGSLQGTAEAFRFTNLIWHFNDFTVAHSHLTMYGIICFFLWASIYAIVPRLTGREAPQITIGAHFWLALIGLMFYSVPLMYGGTLRGIMWMEAKPFMESVAMMAPYWLWRAIGGSLMWLSHLFFAYNIYKMYKKPERVDIQEVAVQKMEEKLNDNSENNQ